MEIARNRVAKWRDRAVVRANKKSKALIVPKGLKVPSAEALPVELIFPSRKDDEEEEEEEE